MENILEFDKKFSELKKVYYPEIKTLELDDIIGYKTIVRKEFEGVWYDIEVRESYQCLKKINWKEKYQTSNSFHERVNSTRILRDLKKRDGLFSDGQHIVVKSLFQMSEIEKQRFIEK